MLLQACSYYIVSTVTACDQAGAWQAKGAYTKAGTWAPNQEEANMIEAIVDRDERWEESLVGKEQYIDRPIQPPGLLGSGLFTIVHTCNDTCAF